MFSIDIDNIKVLYTGTPPTPAVVMMGLIALVSVDMLIGSCATICVRRNSLTD